MNYGFADENFDNDWANDTVFARLKAVQDVHDSVKFLLYTRFNVKREIMISSPKEKTNAMIEFVNTFDPYIETKIFIHGWQSSVNISAANGVIQAYLKNRRYNIIGKL